jgi:hypothetical protein
MFENRLLRRISGPKRGEVAGMWRKLHNVGCVVCTLAGFYRRGM